jgi:serpin B
MNTAKPFQLKIFQEINKSNIGKNLMISPLSIYHILSLTTNGAQNQTLEEMVKTLGHENKDEMNNENKLVSSSVGKLQSIEMANAVFTKFKPEDQFTSMIKVYKSTIDILKDVEQVNKWCSEATHNKIQNILDKLTPNDLMVLINAIYFKGIWKKTFDKNKTYQNNFNNFNKTPIMKDFMNITDNFDYFENDNIQSISLNYTKDNLKALIILPRNDDINTYINNFSSENYIDIIKNLNNQKVNLSLPKFEINFSARLEQNFINLGMVLPFSDSADFSGMTREHKLKIGRIIHKTFIKVDEEGTEAAAATVVVMTKRCFIPTLAMNVDHPFLFIIRSDDLPPEHDILFASKIESL